MFIRFSLTFIYLVRQYLAKDDNCSEQNITYFWKQEITGMIWKDERHIFVIDLYLMFYLWTSNDILASEIYSLPNNCPVIHIQHIELFQIQNRHCILHHNIERTYKSYSSFWINWGSHHIKRLVMAVWLTFTERLCPKWYVISTACSVLLNTLNKQTSKVITLKNIHKTLSKSQNRRARIGKCHLCLRKAKG